MKSPSCSTKVSFQWKNPDFLFNNPDFLQRNLDFVSNNVDFTIKQEGAAAAGRDLVAAVVRPCYLLPGKANLCQLANSRQLACFLQGEEVMALDGCAEILNEAAAALDARAQAFG